MCPKEIRRLLRQRSIVAPCFRVVGRLKGSETGVTLIETLVALALIGIISVAFLSGLATAAKATFIADEQATAESLARSQIEYVQSQGYINYAVPGHDEYIGLEIETVPASYSVEIIATPINPATGLAYGQTEGIFEQDDDIQKITVTVERGDKTVLTIGAYKVER